MAYILSFKKNISPRTNPYRYPIFKTRHNKFYFINFNSTTEKNTKDKFNAAMKDQNTLLNFYIIYTKSLESG
jgi:ribosomal protein S6